VESVLIWLVIEEEVFDRVRNGDVGEVGEVTCVRSFLGGVGTSTFGWTLRSYIVFSVARHFTTSKKNYLSSESSKITMSARDVNILLS
jgi:hypothetical protein